MIILVEGALLAAFYLLDLVRCFVCFWRPFNLNLTPGAHLKMRKLAGLWPFLTIFLSKNGIKGRVYFLLR